MERSQGRFAMKAVADTLAIARSNLVERVARPTKPRRAYRKAADEPLLVLIRRLVDERYRPNRYRTTIRQDVASCWSRTDARRKQSSDRAPFRRRCRRSWPTRQATLEH